MFLHYILQQEDGSLLSKCLDVHIRKIQKWDWINQIYSDFEELKISLSLAQIKSQPQDEYRQLIYEAINVASLS